MTKETYFGQRLRLEARNENYPAWGTINSCLIEQHKATETLDSAYARAKHELEEKSRRWAETFDPLMEFRIIAD